jgi:hypothetical protein
MGMQTVRKNNIHSLEAVKNSSVRYRYPFDSLLTSDIAANKISSLQAAKNQQFLTLHYHKQLNTCYIITTCSKLEF